jgi:phosphate transport system protein
MSEARHRFHQELDSLETVIVTMGELAEQAVRKAADALASRDDRVAREVIEHDDDIDARYMEIERRILDLLARQTPVASDLRLVTAILHISLHLERVGDQAVNVAKLATATRDLPTDETVLQQLLEMADVACTMLRTSATAFVRRDLELALALPAMDDPVDRLNRGMYRQVVALADDPRLLEWGVLMNVVSRALERVADNAVDIGEQVAFLLTGEFREFTDASHPLLT